MILLSLYLKALLNPPALKVLRIFFYIFPVQYMVYYTFANTAKLPNIHYPTMMEFMFP